MSYSCYGNTIQRNLPFYLAQALHTWLLLAVAVVVVVVVLAAAAQAVVVPVVKVLFLSLLLLQLLLLLTTITIIIIIAITITHWKHLHLEPQHHQSILFGGGGGGSPTILTKLWEEHTDYTTAPNHTVLTLHPRGSSVKEILVPSSSSCHLAYRLVIWPYLI